MTPDRPGRYLLQLEVQGPCRNASAQYALSADCVSTPVAAPLLSQATSFTCLPRLAGSALQSFRSLPRRPAGPC